MKALIRKKIMRFFATPLFQVEDEVEDEVDELARVLANGTLLLKETMKCLDAGCYAGNEEQLNLYSKCEEHLAKLKAVLGEE